LYKEYLKCSPTISESTLQGKVHCIIQDIGLCKGKRCQENAEINNRIILKFKEVIWQKKANSYLPFILEDLDRNEIVTCKKELCKK
jgi:hypothetical protein